MEFDNINTLLCAIAHYRNMLKHLLGNKDQSTVDELHDAIANINPDEISGISSKYDVWKTNIFITIENLLRVTKELHSMIMVGLSDYEERIDPDIENVFTFLSKLLKILQEEYDNLKKRRETEPTENDLSIIKNYQRFRNGAYGNMSFYDFVNIVIINDESNIVAIRRLNCLKSQCTDEERTVLDKILNELEHPKSSESSAEKAAKPTEPESVQQQQSQSVEAPKYPLPPFNKMRTYSMRTYSPPIYYSREKLYQFLINESVLKENISVDLFNNCIDHAYLNPLFENGIKYKLKLIVQHLKGYYASEWFDSVCENLGKTREQMSKMHFSSTRVRNKFETKLIEILKKT